MSSKSAAINVASTFPFNASSVLPSLVSPTTSPDTLEQTEILGLASTRPDHINMQVSTTQTAILIKTQDFSTQQIDLQSTPAQYLDSSTTAYQSLVVQILQFKVEYELTDITAEIRNKMATAIANVIRMSSSMVVLSFAETEMNRRRKLLQHKAVLVTVSLKDFQGSTAQFAEQLQQDKLNVQMASLGLKPIAVFSSSTLSGNSVFTLEYM
jgi:hypothetical protein